jgi:hypothetical protein
MPSKPIAGIPNMTSKQTVSGGPNSRESKTTRAEQYAKNSPDAM